jgi:hypothetical protein
MSSPKTITTRKPTNAIRMFKIVPRLPKLSKVKKPVTTFKMESSNHITPVKNPRKSPKMPQEE